MTITLAGAPAPPQGMPSSVKIGGLTGRKITRNALAVKAVFDIPANEPAGRKDVVIEFSGNAAGVLTKAGGFEVRSHKGSPVPPPPRPPLDPP